jgi:hypothetical protein
MSNNDEVVKLNELVKLDELISIDELIRLDEVTIFYSDYCDDNEDMMFL